MAQLNNRTFFGANVMFRNFSGHERPFNSAGDANFCIFLDDDVAEDMKAQGWNIKQLTPREEGDSPQKYVQVKVSYKNRPPKVVMVTASGRQPLEESQIPLLDIADIEKWDVVISPYQWEVNGNKGVKAYLKTLYAKLNQDELELRYEQTPDNVLEFVTDDDELAEQAA